MKRKNVTALMMAIVMLLVTVLTACGNTKETALTDAVLAQGTKIDFANGVDSSVLFESDGWTNGDVFNVVWTKSNVKYEDGIMKLGITQEDKTVWLNEEEVTLNYTAGEARTQNYYGYGDYEVKMKPSANPGTASTFFVCTGNYDEKYVLDEEGNVVYNEDGTIKTEQNPHDEIDIEFLGKDTTHVQFNFFVDGKGGNEYMYDLGFDASKEYHEYGFRWTEDSITWFVDDKPVYKVTTDKNATEAANLKIVEKLPSTPGRMLANYWCGNEKAEDWMGKYSGNTKDAGCEYQWITTTAEGKPLNPSITPDNGGEEKPEIDWSASTAINPTFGSTDLYTVVNENTTSNITYSAIGGSSYVNVEMDIADAAKLMNVLHLTLKNNATTDVQVRVNVVDAELLSSGAQNASTNQSATMNGTEVFTDLSWGGSFFNIPAGETATAIIYFNGQVEKLQLMVDSSRNDANTYAGDITVDEIKFAQVGEVEAPVDPDPEKPVDPTPENPSTSGDLTTSINGTEVTFEGNVTDGYGVNADDTNNTVNVVYNGVAGNSYKNIWASISDIAANKNIFSVKITNNGTESVKVRIDIESATQVNANTTACNQSSTQDGVSTYTDLEWGGSMFEIPAGATVVAEVTYDASKTPTNVKIFVDSHTYDDNTSHSGNVTFSEMTFKGEGTSVDPEPEQPAQPEKQYTFTDVNKNMKIKKSVNVRNMPNKYGEKLGAVKTGTEVFVYGICNETGWYKIEYNGGIGYVSVGYVDESTAVEPENPPVEPVDPTPVTPDKPTASGDLTTSINGTEVTFGGNVEDGYIVNADDSKNILNVIYDGMAGNSYKNIWANIGSIAGTKNIFSVKITNNGTESVKVRIDIESATQVNANTTACNQSSTQDGVSTYTDLEWGGSMFEIPAGATVTVEVTYDASKTPTNVKIFVDSHTYDDNNTHSGDVTFSEMTFKGEYTPSETPDTPVTPEYDKLTFWANAGYTVDKLDQAADSVNVKYNGAGNTYAPVGAYVADMANGNNTFTFKITNNGNSSATVRVDIQGTNIVGNTDALNVSATADGSSVYTDLEWGGSVIEVAAGATVTVVVSYDTSTEKGAVTNVMFFTGSQLGTADNVISDVTLSAFQFSTK